jgi:hypothetical protein
MTENEQKIIEAAERLTDTLRMDYSKLGHPEFLYEKYLRKDPLSKAVIDDLINLYLTVLKTKN